MVNIKREHQKGGGRAEDDKMLPLSLLRLIRAQREIWTGAEIREKVGECCITSFLADVSHKLDDPGRILILNSISHTNPSCAGILIFKPEMFPGR